MFKNCQTPGKDNEWNVGELCSTHTIPKIKKAAVSGCVAKSTLMYHRP
jgi:hypothetical protein